MPCRFLPLLLATAGVLTSQKKPLSIAGQVRDAAGKPAAAKVIVRWRLHPELPGLVGYTLGAAIPGGRASAGVGEKTCTVAKDGRFKIVPPHRGPFLLVAISGKTSSTQVFPVMPGGYHFLRLEPSHYMTGRVVGRDGKPVAGATVRMTPTDNLQRIRLGLYRQPERRGSTQTDPSGRFALHFEHGYLRDPRWNVLMALQAEKDGYLSGTPQHLRPTDGSKSVTLEIQSKATMRLAVKSRTDGKPVAGAKVVDLGAPGFPWRTDERGICVVDVLRGSELMVHAPGHQPLIVTRPSKPGTTRHVVVSPGLKLQVRLSGNSGPLAGASLLFVTPRSTTHPIEWHARVGKDGEVAVQSIPSGVRLLAFVEVAGRYVKFYDGMPRRHLHLAPVQVQTAVQIHGRVVATDKMPVSGARVELDTHPVTAKSPRRVTYTDRGGRFWFDSVLPADCTIVVAKGDVGQRAVALRKAALTEPLTIEMQPGKTITGQLLRPTGEPHPGAWVTIYRTVPTGSLFIRGPRATSTTLGVMADAKGRFRFAGLRDKTSWTLTGAILHGGAHCNASSTATAGASNLVLRTTVVDH